MDNQNSKKRLIKRLRIISGQITGIEKMIEGDKYCVDIITQTLAAREALSGIENAIFENHLSGHVVQQMKSGKEAKAVREILLIHKLSKKK